MSDPSGQTTIEYDVNDLSIYDFFEYWPSLALACIALALYTVAAAVVGWLTERRKTYRFMHIISLTGLLEASGYAALVYAIEMSGKGSVFNAYVAMQVFVILSPNLIQAGMYWLVGLVLSFSPDLTRGRRMLRGWVITTIFALADFFAIIIQAIGISIWATSQASGTPDQDQIRLGCGITLAGLALQLLFFAGFTVLTIWTHRHPNNGLRGKSETRKLFIGLYTAMVLLTIRNVFRFAEFVQSTVLTWPPPEDVYVLSEQQVLFYTLDTLPILLSFLTFALFHPGYLLPAGGPKQPAGGPKQVADLESAGGGKGGQAAVQQQQQQQQALGDGELQLSAGQGSESEGTGGAADFQVKVLQEDELEDSPKA